MVLHFYDEAEINCALKILKEIISQHLPQSAKRRIPRRIGKDESMRSAEDICLLMHDFLNALVDAPAASFPSFVAFRLSRLPAIDTAHFDISALSQQVRELQAQVKDIRTVSVMKEDLSCLKTLITDSVRQIDDIHSYNSSAVDSLKAELS